MRPILVLAAIGAHAQSGSGSSVRVHLLLSALDTNSDGKLTREEVPERMQGIFFEGGDSNHVNVISGEEITNAASALKSLNIHQDGRYAEDELRPSFGRGRS